MDKEQFQYYENSRYTNKRNKRKTLILDIKDSDTETSLGTGSEFNIKLFEPMNIDKQSEIYLDNVSTFNSNIAQTSDTSAFILKLNEFDMESNVSTTGDDTTKVKMFNSLIIPNEHKNISNNHTSVIQKGKKFNYVCDINPKTIHSLSGKITDLSGNPMFHSSNSNYKFTYSITGIQNGKLSHAVKEGTTFIGTTGTVPSVSGTFLSTHSKTDTTLHFSTATKITSIEHPGSGTPITFTGCDPELRTNINTSDTTLTITNASGTNADLMLNTNDNGRFTAEFSIVSRE
jgi:hypothetical protein